MPARLPARLPARGIPPDRPLGVGLGGDAHVSRGAHHIVPTPTKEATLCAGVGGVAMRAIRSIKSMENWKATAANWQSLTLSFEHCIDATAAPKKKEILM